MLVTCRSQWVILFSQHSHLLTNLVPIKLMLDISCNSLFVLTNRIYMVSSCTRILYFDT